MPRLPKAARDLLSDNGLKEKDMRVLAVLDGHWKTPGQIGEEAGMGMRAVGACLARLVVVQPAVVSVQFAGWKAKNRGNMMEGKYEYRIRVVGTRLLALFEQTRTEAT
ncbi:MAG: hypothetical protein E6Q97_12275 [Desulfurellales bacterium]|nr:MAG: hypothetical protein E6Q97_12275 [Desulfurellales bacterium]